MADPAALPWSGVAVFKRAYGIFRERGYRGRAARGGDPPSLPLVGADRRRRHRHPAGGLAAPLQRLDRRGPAADGRAGRPGHRRRARRGISRTSSGRTSRTGWPARSSTPTGRPPGRCARSSPPITSCSTRSRTRRSRTPICGLPDDRRRAGGRRVRPSAGPSAGRLARPRRMGRGARARRRRLGLLRPPRRRAGVRDVSRLRDGRRRGARASAVRRLPGRLRRRVVRARRPARRLRRPDRPRLRTTRSAGDGVEPGRRPVRPSVGAGGSSFRGASRPRVGRAGRAARRRPGVSRQVHNFGVPGVLEADRLIACRGAHPGRQLVVLPAAQARRGRGPARRRSRRSTTSRSPGSGRAGHRLPAGLRHGRAARSTCSPRCAPATWCSSRTAGTARRWPRPATTSTTST